MVLEVKAGGYCGVWGGPSVHAGPALLGWSTAGAVEHPASFPFFQGLPTVLAAGTGTAVFLGVPGVRRYRHRRQISCLLICIRSRARRSCCSCQARAALPVPGVSLSSLARRGFNFGENPGGRRCPGRLPQ